MCSGGGPPSGCRCGICGPCWRSGMAASAPPGAAELTPPRLWSGDGRSDAALAWALGSLVCRLRGLASRHLDSGCLWGRPRGETVVLPLVEPRCPSGPHESCPGGSVACQHHGQTQGRHSRPETASKSHRFRWPVSPFPHTTCPSACTASKCKRVSLKEASPKSCALGCSGGQVGPVQIPRPPGFLHHTAPAPRVTGQSVRDRGSRDPPLTAVTFCALGLCVSASSPSGSRLREV